MMSAQDYRDRADGLLCLADDSIDYADICELERLALEWRKLAVVADWQDAMALALARRAAEDL